MGLKLSVSVSRPQTSLPPSTGVPASMADAPSAGAVASGDVDVSVLLDPQAPARSAMASTPEVSPDSRRREERGRRGVIMGFLRSVRGLGGARWTPPMSADLLGL